MNLQIAVETGTQSDLDKLLARKTRSHMIQLAAVLLIALLAITVVVPFAMRQFGLEMAPPPAKPVDKLVLPPENECPRLSDQERHDLAAKLQEVAEQLHFKDLPDGSTDKELTATLAALDVKLPKVNRERKSLAECGAIQRQVRALLWVHGVAGYNERGLNTVELMEKLETHFVQEQQP